jgi:hypothetical protein
MFNLFKKKPNTTPRAGWDFHVTDLERAALIKAALGGLYRNNKAVEVPALDPDELGRAIAVLERLGMTKEQHLEVSQQGHLEEKNYITVYSTKKK